MSFNAEKYLEAQNHTFSLALEEVRSGKKVNHWIWFIFPRLYGVGEHTPSYNHEKYDLRSVEEARQYLEHPVLRERLIAVSEALLENEGDPKQIFDRDRPDYNRCDTNKVHSCMTLFMAADPTIDTFRKVIDKFYDGKPHRRTVELLQMTDESDGHNQGTAP